MNILAYFPGIDYTSDDQFGRRVHVKELVKHLDHTNSHSAWFLIGDPGDEFEHIDSISEVGYSDTVVGRIIYEIYRCVVLVYMVKSMQIDVIYTRDSPYFAPIFVNLLTEVPLVVEANGIPEDEVSNTFFERAKKRIFNRVRRIKRTRASSIIAVSDGIREHLLEENPSYNLCVIENGVNVDKFSLQSPVANSPPYTICYVGGLQRWQGIETMIQTIENITLDADLIIVGGTENRCSELRQFVRERNLESRVEIVGRVPHEKVPNYINCADLCFGPFVKTRKASPLKIYEYVSCGREVVYANKEGLDNLQSIPGVYQLNYSLDSDSLAKEIEQILINVKTNNAGREFIIKNYSWESVVGSVLEECAIVVNKE